jgi:acyl carrier protein
MNVRNEIIRIFHEILQETGAELRGELTDQSVLLESGLDSLGFAILVARLDEELGYDPFSISNQAFYPTTFGEFVSFYEQHGPGRRHAV